MIQTNELRRGNKLIANDAVGIYPAGIIEVYEVLEDGVNLSMGDNTIYECENLEPIPLTPEILEKCGFVYEIIQGQSEDDEYEATQGYTHWVIKDKNFCLAGDKNGNIHHGIPIKHLHQLQNLYFALTGEELQINL